MAADLSPLDTRSSRPLLRVFDHAQLWIASDTAVFEAARLLASAARADFGQIGGVIGIAEGGRTPATVIAAHLDVPVRIVQARHNPTGAAYTQATGKVTCDTGNISAGSLCGQLLLVDDICGTGATLCAVADALASPGLRLISCVLCLNAGARMIPDLWVWEVRDWVVFPWETVPDTALTRVDLPIPTEAHVR